MLQSALDFAGGYFSLLKVPDDCLTTFPIVQQTRPFRFTFITAALFLVFRLCFLTRRMIKGISGFLSEMTVSPSLSDTYRTYFGHNPRPVCCQGGIPGAAGFSCKGRRAGPWPRVGAPTSWRRAPPMFPMRMSRNSTTPEFGSSSPTKELFIF